MKGKKRHDFDVSFRKSVSALYKSDLPLSKRIIEVEKMTEGYYNATNEYPSDEILEKLADVLLVEELTDTNVDKMSKTEYPILSQRQESRRSKIIEYDFDWGDEIEYKNELFREYFVYKPPLQKLKEDKKKKNLKFTDVTIYDNKTKKLKGSRTEDDVKWSRSVKERDGYCCQNPNCSSRVGIMNAHHMESYVDNPLLRTDLNNGITLCESCHIEFHSIYGKGKNTWKQLNEFFLTA